MDARALRDDQCPLQRDFVLSALPEGFLGAVFLRLGEVAFHADMSQLSAAFYNMGSVIQVGAPASCSTGRAVALCPRVQSRGGRACCIIRPGVPACSGHRTR